VARRRFRQAGPRRKFTWEAALVGGTDTVVEGSVVAGWARPPANSLDTTMTTPQRVEPDATLTRTICYVGVNTNNGGAQVTRPFNLGFGIIAWEGITDDPLDLAPLLPHPILDAGQDWIYRYVFPQVQDNTAYMTNAVAGELALESKAQRKLSGGVGLLFCFGYAEITGAGPGSSVITIAADARFLLKLP